MTRFGWLVPLASALVLSGCGGAMMGSPSAEQPGTRVTLRNPDPAKWAFVRPREALQRPATGQVTQVWVCRPSLCSRNTLVGVQTQPSPARHPDRKTLDKMAKFMPAQARAQDIMMEAVSDGEERMTALSSKVTEVRGYPAIVGESKRTSKDKVAFMVRGELFIGVILVRVLSVSPDRDEAKRNFDAFVTSLEILDVPREESPTGSVAPAALESPPAATQAAQ